jgi:superfamily II RNA helicase
MFLNKVSINTIPTIIPEHPYDFPLDPFQQHAISAISKDENVLVCAKTGSGKTLVGEYQIYHSLKKGKRVFYTTPIKSLSNQKFNDLKKQFADASVGIMTGDIKFCPDAQIVIMTTEILRNLLYKKGTTTESLGLTASISTEDLDAVVFDECHYINDKDRGKIWEETMILLPREVNLVMLSATLDHPEYFAEWLGNLKQKPIHLIETQYRIVPLTHNLLSPSYDFIELMDAKESYKEKVYIDWLRDQKQLEDDKKSYQKKVKEARQGGFEGAVDGKVRDYSFTHKMNQTIRRLEQDENLPALFFVLSRKGCESYAKQVEGTLLTTSDTAAVKHIISFHLHRHMKQLEIIPQYHQIYDLLIRGIAFHHSGLLPLLKEIIEILFSKGYIKILFCTETFAVGLNMPTKTVIFAGFKKYDDKTGGMRMLRTDEYIQMAGRAGRRGKDTKGIVIYLPDREPVTSQEMKAMMTGSRPPITSRMDFHYDFILKTLQASQGDEMKWKDIMEKSYWFQQYEKELSTSIQKLEILQKNTVTMEELFYKGCSERDRFEGLIKTSTNATKKEHQRQLSTLTNKQLGPKWVDAWKTYQKVKQHNSEVKELDNYIESLKKYEESVRPSVEFLYRIGYIKHNDPLTLKNSDLTLKGILATEINEAHQILMTELYTRELLHSLSEEHILSVLACFLSDSKVEDEISINDLNVSKESRDVIRSLQNIIGEYQALEDKYGYYMEGYWDLSLHMIEPILKWYEGVHISIICQEYGVFEGNFMRSIMKMNNILDEWLALAIYCNHVDQIDKILSLKLKLNRDTLQQDSLYLHI